MTFGELFILAGTNTVFTVFLGERTSERIEILDSDFGAGTKEAEVLNRLMPKNVLRYIPGKMQCSRIPGQMKYPHISVVLEDADCLHLQRGCEEVQKMDERMCQGSLNGDFSKVYEDKALKYAEEHGIVEYEVNGCMMEYWTFYGKSEGWRFVRVDLDFGKEAFRGAAIPWDSTMSDPIPRFLKNDKGLLKYNYMQG